MKRFRLVLFLVFALANGACAGTSGTVRNGPLQRAPAAATDASGRQSDSTLPPTVETCCSFWPGAAEQSVEVPRATQNAASPDSEGGTAESERQAVPLSSALVIDVSEPMQTEVDAMGLYGDDVANDPWEGYNRRIHRFNNAIDKHLVRPLARGYAKAIPAPVRSRVTRVLHNLGEPTTAINQALQGDPVLALRSLGRFALNTTIGIAGVFDPASRMGLRDRGSEDFGQTLALWGWRDSRYLVVPLLGPRTVRDAIAIGIDHRTAPLRYVDDARAVTAVQLLDVVDGRAQLSAFDEMRENAYDDYLLVRDAWLQRRGYQIDRDAYDD